MSEDQFIGIYFALMIIMITLEVGMLSVCKHLRDIKGLLEKKRNDFKQPPEGVRWEEGDHTGEEARAAVLDKLAKECPRCRAKMIGGGDGEGS